MEQTSIYNLNQWVEEDRIQREDFNADNAKIEAALSLLNTDKFVIGSYTGDNSSNRKINLGFTPKFVILLGHISNAPAFTIATSDCDRVITGECESGTHVRVVEGGFKVGLSLAHNNNYTGKIVTYIAFK